ncbi:MAG: hypothetical protein ACTSVF_03675, partial [Candidatus Asgardarchaeia archaeon]
RLVDSSPAKGSQLPKATLGASFPHSRFSQRGSALRNRLFNQGSYMLFQYLKFNLNSSPRLKIGSLLEVDYMRPKSRFNGLREMSVNKHTHLKTYILKSNPSFISTLKEFVENVL